MARTTAHSLIMREAAACSRMKPREMSKPQGVLRLSKTQVLYLGWLADDEAEFGAPGNRRTFDALRRLGLACKNPDTLRKEITQAGRDALAAS